MIIYYIFICITGLAVGSFLNVCIHRLPLNESIVKPRSHCTGCGTKLSALDLVPVLSFIFLRARCRYCGGRISIRYPLVELITAITFITLFKKFGITIDFIASVYLMSLLIIAVFIDIDHRIIPDELVITGLAGGIILIVYNIFQPLQIYGDRLWWNPFIGMITGSGILFLVALIGSLIYKTDDAMGMGDVKIFIPIGIFLGWRMCIVSLILSVFIGGAISFMLIITRIKRKKDTIPFGPFIGLSVFLTYLWGWEIINWYVGKL